MPTKIVTDRVLSRREDPPKKPPTQIKQFAQTVCANNFGTFCAKCPPFSFKKSRNRQKSLCKPFVQTVFIWLRGFWGGSPSVHFIFEEVIRITYTLFTRPQLGPFFVLKFVRSRGFGARFLQPFPKSVVTVEYYANIKYCRY